MPLPIDQAQSPSLECPSGVQQCGFSEKKNVNRAGWRGSWEVRTNRHTGIVYLPVLGKGGRAFYIGPGLFLSLCMEQSQTLNFSLYRGNSGRPVKRSLQTPKWDMMGT